MSIAQFAETAVDTIAGSTAKSAIKTNVEGGLVALSEDLKLVESTASSTSGFAKLSKSFMMTLRLFPVLS